MFRKKNGQEFMDETNLDSSTNDKEEKKGFFHRKKKKEINLYEDDMGYIEDDSNFDEDEYDKELEELQAEEKPEKKRGFFHRLIIAKCICCTWHDSDFILKCVPALDCSTVTSVFLS